MLKNVKSVYISKIIFSYLDEMSRLKTIKCNKKLQNLLNISLYNYQIVSGRYIIYETNEIAKEYDVVLSLANGMRAGAIADSTDRAQVQELIVLGELIDRSRDFGVQCMIEGPGHIPINEIPANVMIQKKLCSQAPFYMLGPIVCDVAPGYDHIVSAIGAAESAKAGADFICYVTPAEHLALPSPEDVKEGVIATRIGAYAGDMAKGAHNGERDLEMAYARKNLDWEEQYRLALTPDVARAKRDARPPEDTDACTMCGNFCAVKLVNEWLDSGDHDILQK